MTDDPKPAPDQDEAEENTREHSRVEFFSQVKVVVPDEDTSIDVFASNVSKGGIFLRSNQALPQGKKVALNFETENGPVMIDEGEVRWSQKFEPISVDGTAPGMGVEFQKMAPESQHNIEDFIDEALANEDGGSEAGDPPAVKLEPPQSGPPVAPIPDVPSDPPPTQAQNEAAPIDQPVELPTEPTPLVPKSDFPETVKTELDISKPSPRTDGLGQTPLEKLSIALNLDNQPPQVGTIEEGEMAVLSKPPPPRTKMLLFVGFVILVAVGTFLTLMWLNPFGDQGAGPAKKPAPVDKPDLAPVDKPDVVDKPDPAPVDKPDVVDKPDPAPVDKPDVVDKPDPAPVDKPDVVDKAPIAPGPPRVSAPVFTQDAQGWRMELAVNKPTRFKHFTLKNPPRLAVDVLNAHWINESKMETPLPIVNRIRFGKQPKAARLVLDFKGKKVPKLKIERGKDRLTIRFY
jgi:uncharacterized protein (TIGR02266 family)